MGRRGLFIFFICILFLVLAPFAKANLGISPAIVETDFVPGLEETIKYRVSSDNPNQKITLYSGGSLEDSISINKREIDGAGEFKATLELPDKIEEPGNHRVIIGAEEEVDKELAGNVGTSLAVQAVIEVFVPYPGKYLELDFEAEDVNAGESSEMLLDVVNKGKQGVSFSPRIIIFDKDGEKVETLYLKERSLDRSGDIKLRKVLNTTGYDPGEYTARAVVDYEGKTAKENDTLNIGHLFVNITDYKKKYTPGEVKEFSLEAESRWNEKIKSVYADVTIFKEGTDRVEFRTSPRDFSAWEVANISGYFEPGNVSLRSYDINMELNYENETTIKSGEIIFEEPSKGEIKTSTIFIIVGIFLVLLLIVFIIWRKRRNEK